MVFFENFSKDNPGRFPSRCDRDQKRLKKRDLDPAGQGRQRHPNPTSSTCARQEHADADLQDVPGDMVTTLGSSGLDPHITLENAEFQLDRVAAKWAADTKQDPAKVRQQIEEIYSRKRRR